MHQNLLAWQSLYPGLQYAVTQVSCNIAKLMLRRWSKFFPQ